MNQQLKKSKVLLLGDLCKDVTHLVTSNRNNPENVNVPLVEYSYCSTDLGMSGFVAQCFYKLGLSVTKVQPKAIGTKERIYRVNEKGEHEYLLRIDRDIETKPVDLNSINLAEFDIIVVSDYCKGFITTDVLRYLDAYCVLNNKMLFVDTKKKNLSYLSGNTVLKINEDEANSIKPEDWPNNAKVIITRSSKGTLYNGKVYNVPQVKAVDVCGAGDIFLAYLVYWYSEGLKLTDAIAAANHAASISVQHQGKYIPSLEETQVKYETIR